MNSYVNGSDGSVNVKRVNQAGKKRKKGDSNP